MDTCLPAGQAGNRLTMPKARLEHRAVGHGSSYAHFIEALLRQQISSAKYTGRVSTLA
jgi:hypothetical protein